MVVKLNTVRLNGASLNSASLNGVGERLRASAGGGGGEVIPPEEPDVPDVPVTYTLSASASNGVVSASVNGNAVTLPYTANEGDVVVVEVTANDGYVFEGWSDGSTDNPRSITMTADVTLSATCVVKAVEKEYIQFEDPAVEAVLMANNVSSDGIGITMEDAAAVTSLGFLRFNGNKSITSFNEFVHFVNCQRYNSDNWNYGDFKGCSSLEKISLPPKFTDLQGTFASCSSLKTVANTGQVTRFGNNSFYACGKLESIDLSSAVTICTQAFLGCTSLPEIDIPSTVISIEINAFRQCSSLIKVICRAATPPSAGTDIFYDTNNCPIYVPDTSLEAYKTAVNWSAYADRIHPLSEIEGSPYITFADAEVEAICVEKWSSDGIGLTKEDAANVTSIANVFQGNKEIVTFDELKYFTGVKAINPDAFKDCSSLVWINLVNVSNISQYAFIRCSSWKVVNAPISVVNKLSFKGCSAIESFDFSRVTSIALGAFASALSSIDLICPALTSITGAAFYGSGVKRVLDMGSVATFPYSSDNEQTGGVFANSPNLELAILPSTTSELRSTFENCKALRVCIVKAATPPAHNGYVFSGASALEVIYVPDTSVDTYKASTNWVNHASIIKGISLLATDNSTLYEEIKDYLS